MSQNPYQPPAVEAFAIGDEHKREQLRNVARYQQWVIYSLLVNIILNVAVASLRGQEQLVILALTAVVFCVAIFAAVAVFLLTKALGSPALGVLYGILMFVPCISLLVLLAVNSRATNFLQSNGVKVGFMGADPSRI